MTQKRTAVVLLVFFFFSIVAGVYLVLQREVRKYPEKPVLSGIMKKQIKQRENIMIIKASGMLRGSYDSQRFGLDGVEIINRKLKEAAMLDNIKGVVLRINSPGGSVATVQEIYNEILSLRSKGKIVVASLGDVCASGGYYIASACDRIVANPGSITGSIGVIMEIGNVEELFKKIGVKIISIKSGRFKDIGSPVRTITDEERQIFQSLINDAYSQFVDSIVKGRGMDKNEVLALSDGRIFTGKQALDAGLVDNLGGQNEAVRLAADISGINENEIRVYEHGYNLKYLFSLIESRVANFGMFSGLGLDRKPEFRLEYIME